MNFTAVYLKEGWTVQYTAYRYKLLPAKLWLHEQPGNLLLMWVKSPICILTDLVNF